MFQILIFMLGGYVILCSSMCFYFLIKKRKEYGSGQWSLDGEESEARMLQIGKERTGCKQGVP